MGAPPWWRGMSEREIRSWCAEDLDEILEVESQSFQTPWSRQAFEEEFFTNELAHYLVLLDANRVVGYAGMWMILDEAHVTNVAVRPECRGQGWGGGPYDGAD